MPYAPPINVPWPAPCLLYNTGGIGRGQVAMKCHQHHQLLCKICHVYVTNVYSYVLMMQIQICIFVQCWSNIQIVVANA